MSMQGWMPGGMPALAGRRRGWGWLARLADAAVLVLDELLVIRVIILRQLKTKYLNHPLGLLLEFMKPVVICTVHYFYFSMAGRRVPDDQYLVFVIGGFTIWFCFSTGYREAGRRHAGGFTSIPGVSEMHLNLAAAIWPFCVYFLFASLVAYPCMLVGAQLRPPDLWLTLLTYGMAAGLAFGFGLIMQAVAEVLPALDPFLKLFGWLLFITCGIYDSMVTMPAVVAPIVWYNPLIHLVEFQRHAFDPGYPVYFVTLWYPAAVMGAAIAVGLVLNRILANRQAARLPG